MVPFIAQDEIFLRLKAAWIAYEGMQPKRPLAAIPYLIALADGTDLLRQAAAIELAAARGAWLTPPLDA